MKMGPHAFSTGRLGTAFKVHSKPLTRDILGFAIENYHMKKEDPLSLISLPPARPQEGRGQGGQNPGQFREQDTTKGTQHKKEEH